MTGVCLSGCGIGDIIIIEAFGGFIIRRVMARAPSGLGWEAIGCEEERDAAIQHGCALTKALESRLWIYEDDQYQDITPSGAQPVP